MADPGAVEEAVQVDNVYRVPRTQLRPQRNRNRPRLDRDVVDVHLRNRSIVRGMFVVVVGAVERLLTPTELRNESVVNEFSTLAEFTLQTAYAQVRSVPTRPLDDRTVRFFVTHVKRNDVFRLNPVYAQPRRVHVVEGGLEDDVPIDVLVELEPGLMDYGVRNLHLRQVFGLQHVEVAEPGQVVRIRLKRRHARAQTVRLRR